jgi:hypothetical protein
MARYTMITNKNNLQDASFCVWYIIKDMNIQVCYSHKSYFEKFY